MAVCFLLTDDVLQVKTRQVVHRVGPFQLLNAHNDAGFHNTVPLSLAEVLEELAHFAAAYQLLFEVFH